MGDSSKEVSEEGYDAAAASKGKALEAMAEGKFNILLRFVLISEDVILRWTTLWTTLGNEANSKNMFETPEKVRLRIGDKLVGFVAFLSSKLVSSAFGSCFDIFSHFLY